MKFKSLSILLISIFSLSLAQNSPWDLLLNNEFEKAREAFSTELQADSLNQQALLGALFLADIYRDDERYYKLKKKLFVSATDPLFWNTFYVSTEDLLEKKKLPDLPYFDTEIGKIDAKIAEVYHSKNKQLPDHKELKKEFDPIYQNNGWAFLGPFKNINGEGHLMALPPEERRSPDWKAVYDSGLDLDVYWVKPAKTEPVAFLNANDYLMSTRKANLYYAHKSVYLQKPQQVQLRIARSSPIKVWVDGKLVLDNPDPIALRLDGEIVELDLSQGRHDLMIKITPFSGWKSFNGEFSLMGSQNRNTPYEEEFNMRFTNLDAAPLPLPLAKPSQTEGRLLSHRSINTNLALHLLEKMKGVEESRIHPSDYYVLARYYLITGQSRQIEKLFVDLEKEMPNSTYIDLLLAAIYERNGNRAMAYKTMSKIDLDQTPFYPLLKKKLDEVDPKVDKATYEDRLESLRKIAPSNRDLLRKYVRYYERQDDSAHLAIMKQQTLQTYPNLEEFFDGFDITASEEAKKEKEKNKKNKKNFSYNTSFKKKLERVDEALANYPYQIREYRKKANLLINEKMWTEALEVLDEALAITPFASSIHSLKGKVYKELNQTDSALKYLKIAQYQSAFEDRSYGYYGSQSLSEQIANLEGEEESLWDSFQGASLDDILARKEEWSSKYKDEDALVLLHTSRNWIKNSGDAEIKENFALIILNENGIPEWTQNSFNFLGSKVSVEVIKPDGSRVQPERSGSYAVFKNLEVGDIIWAEGSYSYKKFKNAGGRYGFNKYGALSGGKSFKSPVFYQNFEVASPPEEKLLYQTVNVPVEVNISEKEGYKYFSWEWYHTPKSMKEDAAYSYYAGSPFIKLITELDWTAFSDWYQKLTYRKLEPNYYIKNLYKEIVKEDMSDEEKVVAIYNYITQEVTYSSASFLQSNFEPQEPQLTCSAQIGDCKDVATLMLTFLKMADIESYFVLVRASKYLPYKPLTSNVFNHAIVAYVLDGETHYLDLTTNKYPHYVLPEQDHEAWALLIKDGKQDLFRLPNDKINPEKNLVSYDLKASLNDEGTLTLGIKGSYKGIEGGYVREFVGAADGPKLESFIQKELNLSFMAGNEVRNKHFAPMDSIDLPLKVKMDITAPDFAEKLYGLYIFPLPILERLELFEEFLPTTRQSVMDLNYVMNLSPKDVRVELGIPEGYELFAQPENVKIENEFGKYELDFRQVDGKLLIHKKHVFYKSKIFQEEYAAFRDWYFQIARLDASKIVLAEKGFRYPKR